jgi:hypothetical protein
MKLRMLIGALATVLAVGLLTPPAGAGTVVRNDPAGDTAGPGGILAVRLRQAGPNVLAQVRTNRPLDIFSAPSWNNGSSLTQLRFNFDTDGDPNVDYAVVVDPGPTVTVLGIAHSPAPRIPCAFVSQPEPDLIRVKVTIDCVGTPADIRTFARYRFDRGGNGSIDTDDRAPNVGYTPPLVLED